MLGYNTDQKGNTNADKLRNLLNGISSSNPEDQAANYFKNNLVISQNGLPSLDDLVRLIQSIENVNQQLLFENKYLKEETTKTKADILKLIEENCAVYKELKSCTVLDILSDIQESAEKKEKDDQREATLKKREEEMSKTIERIKMTENSNNGEFAALNKSNVLVNNTRTNSEGLPLCCRSCSEESDIKFRKIENLKSDNENLTKLNKFLKSKNEEYEVKETDLMAQVNKYLELVKHIELEKDQANSEKEQYAQEKLKSDKKIETIISEYQENLNSEKKQVIEGMESEINKQSKMIQELEEKAFNQESLVDRLTRDKISLTSELEGLKKRLNSIDVDNVQMVETMRRKYHEITKERDTLSYNLKDQRTDYDSYVKETDQEMYCLRNELNQTRNRLLETEKDTIVSKDQCIVLTEEINGLKNQLLSLNHTKNTIENSREDNLKELNETHRSRESKLIQGIQELQSKYSFTVNDLEDLCYKQKGLIKKQQSELRTLNNQIDVIASKYKNDVTFLNNTKNELETRIEKYRPRIEELEEQSSKHNQLHDKMKIRLTEMNDKILAKSQELQVTKSNEELMKTTNIQLIQEIETIKKQLNLYAIPTKATGRSSHKQAVFTDKVPSFSMPLVSSNAPMDSARSAIQDSIYSIKSKLAL